MTTVRAVTYDLLRDLGMTTIFGNPGSTEEPFLTEFPGRLPLHPGVAGGRRRGDGRRLRAGQRQCRVRESAHRFGRRQRHGGAGHGMAQPDAVGGDGRSADAADAGARTVAGQPRGDRAAPAVRQVEPRADAGRGCSRRHRAGLPHRHGAAAGTGLRLHPDGRLGSAGRVASGPLGRQPGRTGREGARTRLARGPGGRDEAGAGRRRAASIAPGAGRRRCSSRSG